MRGIFILLAFVCIASAFVPRNVEKEDVDLSTISQWLNFDLTYDDKLSPLVSVLCAPLDYVELSIIPGWPQQSAINKLQKSLCSKLPQDMRLDFSYLKQCLNDSACFLTNKMEFLVGLTDENIFFSHYNMEKVPKTAIASACLKEQDSCPNKNEAEQLLGEWKTLLQQCDSVEDKQQLKEAVEGVSAVALVSEDDSLTNWYQQTLSDCLILAPSVEIKRMMAEKLEPTAACSEQVRDKLMEMMETEWNAPMDVVMTVTRLLMNCENETLALMVEDMLTNNDNSYQTGYAVWETMKMMADERYELRKRRDLETSYEKTLNTVVSNPQLQDKWNSGPFTWKYTYTLPETAWSSKTIYTAFISFDTSADKPLATVRLSEVSSYPPLEHHVVIALESELMKDLNKFINGEYVDITQIYRYITEQGLFIPFKLSVTMLSDEFDYSSEQMTSFVENLSSQMNEILVALSELPELGKIAIDRIGNTKAGIQVFYETDESGAHVTLVVKQPTDGSSLAEVTLRGKLTENEEGMLGFSITAKASVFGEQFTRYDVTAEYQPLTENLKDKTQCEMKIEIYDETSEKSVLSLSSCMRPVFMSDPSEPLRPLANMYRTLEIPNWLHLNFTLDFGTNGFIGFVSSPKTLLFNVHYLENLLVELTAKLELQLNDKSSSRKKNSKKEPKPLFRAVTSAEVRVPSLSERAASFEMNSKLFEDFSADSIFHISTFMDVDGLVRVYDGVLDASSCASGMEDFMTGIMFTGTMEDMPEQICYDVMLHLPREMGTLSQNIKYDVESSEFSYTYDLDITSGSVDLSGKISMSGQGDNTITCSVASPIEAEISISNHLDLQCPDLTQKVNHFQMSPQGMFVNVEPMEGFCDEGFVGSFSLVDHSCILESPDAPDNYALCSFQDNANPFMGEFFCDLKCDPASKKLSVSNDGEKFELNTECEYGSVNVNLDMEKLWGSVSDEDSTEVGQFVVGFAEPQVVVKVVPGFSGDSGLSMCTLVEYEGGEVTEDVLNRECLNETLSNTNWAEYVADDVSEFLQTIDMEHPAEWSVESVTELVMSLYEKFLAHYEEYFY